jgi:NADPH:quinone reductase-like Zn-dependent oxidoreductase
MTMKQWITNFSGLANLKQEVVPVPEPQENEVLVKISAVSLNFRDVEGEYKIAGWPFILRYLCLAY